MCRASSATALVCGYWHCARNIGVATGSVVSAGPGDGGVAAREGAPPRREGRAERARHVARGLERDDAPELRVERLVNCSEATSSDLAPDLERLLERVESLLVAEGIDPHPFRR